MPTGLPPGKTIADNDWVSHFSNFQAAWALAPPRAGGKARGEGIVVVHPDTGYTEHPELTEGGRYLTDDAVAKNFYHEGYIAKDDLRGWFPSHGTRTASVMMSSVGAPASPPPTYTATDAVTGVAPMADVIPLLVARSVMLSDRSDAALAKGIRYAMSLNQDHVGVMSISLGRSRTGGVKKSVETALKDAANHGIVVCAAAGQAAAAVSGLIDPTFPGSDPHTICVGACDANHGFLNTGFHGPAVEITAPGVDVWKADAMLDPANSFLPFVYDVSGTGTGTSYATAVTAGACALWQAHHGRPWLLAQYGAPLILPLFREVLRRSCHTPTGWDTANFGAGVLDALALLQEPLLTKAQVEAL